MAWTNSDGLTVLFGNEKGEVSNMGSPAQAGEYKTLVIELDSADFAAFGTEAPVNAVRSVYVPSGAHIVDAVLDVTTAFAGATATLTIGTEEADGTTIDADGIDAAIAVGSLTEGAQIQCDGAQVNGAALTEDAYFTVTVGTANFTAGKAQLTVKYIA